MSEAIAGQIPAAEVKSEPFFLSPADHGIVAFHILPSLPYGPRLSASFVLVFGGLGAQAIFSSFWYGMALVFVGSLLMTVKGFNNLVDIGRFRPSADWDKVELARLRQLVEMDRKILRWNRSFMDATNGLGVFTMIVILVPVVFIGFGHLEYKRSILPWEIETIILDAALLLLPHWFTGVRRILRLPKLMVKVEVLEDILAHAKRQGLGEEEISLLMMMRGKQKLPGDVKMQVRPKDSPRDFHGLYVQVVTNNVQGTSYPYLYVVLVARQGFGLAKLHKSFSPPPNLIKQFKNQDGVEIIIIRQKTTKTSGYHTNKSAARTVFDAGMRLVRDIQEKA